MASRVTLLLAAGLVAAWGCAPEPPARPSPPQVAPAPSNAGRTLHRPLELPHLAPGAPCPVDRGQTLSSDFGPGIGRGPVYPVPGGDRAVLDLSDARIQRGWWYVKVLWVARPGFPGGALIRGGRLDAPGAVRFREGPRPPLHLRLEPGGTAVGGQEGWTQWPSYTRLRGSGCYAWQVDTAGASWPVVFAAVP
jgi:hypothetical protein